MYFTDLLFSFPYTKCFGLYLIFLNYHVPNYTSNSVIIMEMNQFLIFRYLKLYQDIMPLHSPGFPFSPPGLEA